MEFDPDSWPACWILAMIARDGSPREFYHSKLWARKRAEVMRHQHGECWACKHKRPAILTTAASGATIVVHHRNELRKRPDLALSEYAPDGSLNLVLLCESCHWDAHHERREKIRRSAGDAHSPG